MDPEEFRRWIAGQRIASNAYAAYAAASNPSAGSVVRGMFESPDEAYQDVAPPAQQQVPSTPSETVQPQGVAGLMQSLEVAPAPQRGLAAGEVARTVQPPRYAPSAPRARSSATANAPTPTGLFNPAQQAPAQAPAGATAPPLGMMVSNYSGPVATQFAGAIEELDRGPGVYTGPPTRTVQTLTTAGPLSEQTAEGLAVGDAEIRKAMRSQSEGYEQGIGQQAGVFEAADLQSQLEAQRQQQAAEDQAREMRRQTERADAINQQVLSNKIDPNRVLGDSFSGGRIAAALGLFIAGMAQGETGANAFLRSINQTIDRDIAAQEQNANNLRAGAQNQQSLVGMYRTVFGDEAAARAAARTTMLQSVAQKLQAQQARMGEAGQVPALQMALAQLDVAQASSAADAERARSSTVRTITTRTGGTSGGRNLRVVEARRKVAESMSEAGSRELGDIRQGYQASEQRAEVNPEAVERYGALRGANAEAVESLSRVQEMLDAGLRQGDIAGVGRIDSLLPGWLESDAGRRMKAELGTVKAKYLHDNTGVSATPAEREAAQAIIEGVTEDDFVDRVGRMRTLLAEQRRLLDARFPLEVVQTFGQRLGASTPPEPFRYPARSTP